MRRIGYRLRLSSGLCLHYSSYRHVQPRLQAFITIIREVNEALAADDRAPSPATRGN
ncbi:hypothetical protein [Ectopseudomonas oleovorans]|uniref:hypothetical protein n=1 Tax=Ectopseudomonas oleovorans TaxID=301 RepID=UPI001BAFBFE3|nr:hypothetical protein [Pseudomonas oleovorans]